MDDFTPFLQIVHISDLHVSNSTNAALVRSWIRRLRRRRVLPERIVNEIADGLQGHDPVAGSFFRGFLNDVTKDPEWSKLKTWLVDTGDLTTFGDQDSLTIGRTYLAELTKVCPDLASIYGNHDAWPGKPPLFVASKSLKAQTHLLTRLNYVVAKPGLALDAPIPHGMGHVQLYFVDSVRHDRCHNVRALGKVPDAQLKALKRLVDQNYESDRRDFRILAVHHPVHYPPPRRRLWMSMSNDTDVAKALGMASIKGARPLAHLVLSGHTHFLFPQHGKLPLKPSLCIHPDLGSDQCQFVTGSLMQLDRYHKRSGWPHQCEVLRLYYSGGDPSVLLIERLLVARQTGGVTYRIEGIGPYRFVPLPHNNDEIAEELTFKV